MGAGYYHTCAIKSDGTARCWGYDGLSSLGDGDANGTNRFIPFQVTGFSDGTMIDG